MCAAALLDPLVVTAITICSDIAEAIGSLGYLIYVIVTDQRQKKHTPHLYREYHTKANANKDTAQKDTPLP